MSLRIVSFTYMYLTHASNSAGGELSKLFASQGTGIILSNVCAICLYFLAKMVNNRFICSTARSVTDPEVFLTDPDPRIRIIDPNPDPGGQLLTNSESDPTRKLLRTLKNRSNR